MNNRLTSLTIGAVGLVFSIGTAVADVPLEVLGNDFDQYTVDAAGFIQLDNPGGTYGCPIGGTCTVLEATGPGLLQQKVEYAGDGTFYQTIIIDDGVASIADPNSLEFRNESYAGAVDNSTSNLAAMTVIKQGDLTGFNDMLVESENALGTLVGPDPTTGTGLQAAQRNHQIINGGVNTLGLVDRVMEFWIEDDGAGTRTAINQINPDSEEQYTLRRVTGNYVQAPGTLMLDSGDSFAYGIGANLQVIYKTQAFAGTGSPFDRVLGETIIQECDSSDCSNTVNSYTQNNEDPPGVFAVGHAGGPGTQVTGAGPFLVGWNVTGSPEQTLFGAEPLTYDVNATDDGVVAPAATASSSTTVLGTSFWNTPPKWSDIVPP